MDSSIAICHQSSGKLDIHADTIWYEKPALGGLGHSHCLGFDCLVRDCNLAALQGNLIGPGALLHLGNHGDRSSTDDNLLELGFMNLNIPKFGSDVCLDNSLLQFFD